MKDDEKFDRLELPRPVSPFEQLFGPVGDASVRQQKPLFELEAIQKIAPAAGQTLNALPVLQLFSQERILTLVPFQMTVR